MQAHNPFLEVAGAKANKGGGIFFEEPATVENIVWQTRSKPLDGEEDALAAALMTAFVNGADSLETCASALNDRGLSMAMDTPWTAEGLGQRLARLSSIGF